jgi:hypothetical protein
MVRLIGVAAATVAATCAIGTPAASAGLLSCGAGSQPFFQFDRDTNSYFLIPNGNFESGSTGWTLAGGARVVSGNDPYYISGPGSASLSMPPGSSALGPKTCVAALTPHARMMLVADAGAANLNVQVILYGILGNVLGILNYSTMNSDSYQAWWPSKYVPSKIALPILTSYCRIKITVGAGSGGWRVDDVYEDPWLSGMI